MEEESGLTIIIDEIEMSDLSVGSHSSESPIRVVDTPAPPAPIPEPIKVKPLPIKPVAKMSAAKPIPKTAAALLNRKVSPVEAEPMKPASSSSPSHEDDDSHTPPKRRTTRKARK